MRGAAPHFPMVYRFRVSPSYRYSLLTIYSLSGFFAFNENFALYSMAVKSTTIILFAVFGIWLFRIWNSEIVYDDSKRVLKIGKKKIPADDLIDIEIKLFKVVFKTKSGVISFNYPVEDAQLLIELLRGVKR